MILLEDEGQKIDKHIIKNDYWGRNGIEVVRSPLPVGDYILANDKVLDVIERKKARKIDVKKMDFLGTYNTSVDTKKDMQEIVGNICGKQHTRFRDELILSQNNNIQLYVLIENTDGIKSIEDVFKWHNPRLDIWVQDKNNVIGYYKNGNPRYGRKQKFPTATRGTTLAKAMLRMEHKYGVKFEFCKPSESGQRIIELLSGN